MFGRISPDVGRERFFEEWPETRSKQAFYREYSQNKVKYMGFGAVSSRNVRGTMRDADLDMRDADLDMRDADLDMRDADLDMRDVRGNMRNVRGNMRDLRGTMRERDLNMRDLRELSISL